MKSVGALVFSAALVIALAGCGAAAAAPEHHLTPAATPQQYLTTAPVAASSAPESTPPTPAEPSANLSGTQVACRMLQDNPYVAKITATTHLNIIAKGSLMKGVYECQVGLSQFPRFNPHEVEGGFYCNIDTAKMVTGMTALGGGVYREAELTYILVTGPRTAVMIAKLHTPPPSLPLITAALHTSAGVAASGGCS